MYVCFEYYYLSVLYIWYMYINYNIPWYYITLDVLGEYYAWFHLHRPYNKIIFKHLPLVGFEPTTSDRQTNTNFFYTCILINFQYVYYFAVNICSTMQRHILLYGHVLNSMYGIDIKVVFIGFSKDFRIAMS